MIIRTIPKTAVLRKVNAVFDLDYQLAGDYAGQYLCEDANRLVSILDTKFNCFYLIDNVSISGTVPEEVYVNSLILDELPFFVIRRHQQNELVTAHPYQISQYCKQQSFSTHAVCNKQRDGLSIECTAALNQVIETVGVDTVSIVIDLVIYEVRSDYYNLWIRGDEK